jgi:hypothetical protein
MALTVGVQTVMDAREVVVVVTGLRKALALSKAIGTVDLSPMLLLIDLDRRGWCQSFGRICNLSRKELRILTMHLVDSIVSPTPPLGADCSRRGRYEW